MKPRLIVVAGPNGSGKTTITEKLLRHEWMNGCEYINPDMIALEKYGSWNSQEAIIQAANYAQQLRENYLTEMKSMAFEIVFSVSDKVEFVQRACKAGFFVRLFFICTNEPSINAQRVAIRVLEGGHDVPIPKIIKRYYRSITNCITAVPLVDRAYFYDNSVADCDPSLIFKAVDGAVDKIYAPWNSWTKKVARQLGAKTDQR